MCVIISNVMLLMCVVISEVMLLAEDLACFSAKHAAHAGRYQARQTHMHMRAHVRVSRPPFRPYSYVLVYLCVCVPQVSLIGHKSVSLLLS